jgi:subfamily B ATP-binding cassette protein MsbA
MKSLLRLLPYLRQHLGLILCSALLAIPLSAIRLGPAPVIRYMLDHILVQKDASKLIYFPLALIGLYALNFVVRFAHYYLLRIVIIRVNQKIKNQIFHHLMGLSADYFTTQSTGTLISRTANDPQYIDQGLSCINVLIREPITLVFLFGYVLYLNWRLTVITFLIIPVLVWVFSSTGRNLKRYLSKMTLVNAQLFSTLQESFAGVRIIKTFRLEKYVDKKFRKKNDEFSQLLLKTSLIEEASHPLVELLTAIALAPLIYYGGLQVLEQKMTPGELFAFFTVFAMMMNPIRMMNDVNIKLHQAAAACDRIFEVFDWKSNLYYSPQRTKISRLTQSLELDQVSFAYPDAPDRIILKNVSFQVPSGKAVALVGASGAGKSSLVSLIPRIFDVTSGSIKIDGHDIRNLNLNHLRKLTAVVSQDVFLFNDTIEENIRCGKLSANKKEIEEAARKAHALDFIRTLPEGFATRIGDRGQKLSGGERQRISIARAFLRESPILILDEATSSLDTQSERAVQSALEDLMYNRTTLMIAHRLSTIRQADLILVLRDGEIVERGNHDELLALHGVYAKFHDQPIDTKQR